MDKQKHKLNFLALHLKNICPAVEEGSIHEFHGGLRIDIDLDGDVSYEQMKLLSKAFDTDMIDIKGTHFAGTDCTPGDTNRWLEISSIDIDEVFKYLPEDPRCSKWAYHEMYSRRDEDTPQ
jgi:hypothetical protein